MSQDYESALSESWKIYATAFEIIGEEPNEAFKWVFKRAYALGKQEKDAEDGSLWSRLTDDEKREMQCRYHTNECVLHDHRKRTGDKAQSKAVARMKLLENLFGKDNLKVEKKWKRVENQTAR